MYFSSIQNPDITVAEGKFIDLLLSKGITNTKIMESTYFRIGVDIDSPIQLFYRELWTQTYLRRVDEDAYPERYDLKEPDDLFNEDLPERRFLVYVSIAECLEFINSVTPPALHKDIPDNTKSINAIYDLMKFFLFKEKDPKLVALYKSTFYRVTHMEMFDSNWTPDFKKLALIRKIMNEKGYDKDNYGTFIGYIDASDLSIEDLTNPDKSKDTRHHVQMIFNADTDEDIRELYNWLSMDRFTICNLYCDTNIGLVVSAYTDNIGNTDITDFIEYIYSSLK